MPEYLELYENVKSESESEGIIVTETALLEIKKKGAGLEGGIGFLEINQSNDEVSNIWIDSSESAEMKLRIILHEFGHCKYYKTVGYFDMQKAIAKNDLKFKTENEYEAHKFQLERTKEIVETNGDIQFLKTTLTNFKAKLVGQSKEYKPAIEQLMSENIWSECNLLVEKFESLKECSLEDKPNELKEEVENPPSENKSNQES